MLTYPPCVDWELDDINIAGKFMEISYIRIWHMYGISVDYTRLNSPRTPSVSFSKIMGAQEQIQALLPTNKKLCSENAMEQYVARSKFKPSHELCRQVSM
jgi:hypothetical protein